MPKFCPECGAEIKYRDAKFCPECGYSLKIEEDVEEEYPVEHEELEKLRRKQVKRSNEWAMMSAVSATLGIISLYFWNLFKGLELIGISRPLTPVMLYFGIFLFIVAAISGTNSLHLRRAPAKRVVRLRGRILGIERSKIALLVTVIVVGVVIFFTVDWDRDGLATITEIRCGTGVFDPDTDGDELKDGLEVNTFGSNPLISDTDDDGLNDGLEVNTYGTNPLVADTDGDGLSDSLEVNVHGTNPIVTDSDGDGLNDELEVDGWSIIVAGLHLHVTSNPLFGDSDEDGIVDQDEYSIYRTNPRSADTDNDGLDDWLEINTYTYKTDPLNPDSDADELKDGAEIYYYQTNPLKSDTDKDGLPDGLEVNTLASNPLCMDIFVEVDWMVALDPSVISKLVTVFADAPIQNPDGSTGITLHIDLDDQVPAVNEISTKHEDGNLNDFYDYKERYFSQRKGYHYALICMGIKQDVGGIALGYDLMVRTQSNEYHYPADIIGSIFMHELGHTIGLHSGVYKGIDSYEVPFSDYPSVMNYNAPRDYYGYSSGGMFNDWNYLQERGLRAPVDIIVSVIKCAFSSLQKRISNLGSF